MGDVRVFHFMRYVCVVASMKSHGIDPAFECEGSENCNCELSILNKFSNNIVRVLCMYDDILCNHIPIKVCALRWRF